jgi:hypothetical protein
MHTTLALFPASKKGKKLRASCARKKKKWEMASSGEGDVLGRGAGADPSLSAALAERIRGSTGVQRAGVVVL